MKILIAGGAGFIGSHLCEKLIKKNHQIICIDNLITGNEKNIFHLKKNKNFKFINQDITKKFNLKEKIDIIFHLASPASPNPESLISYFSLWKETYFANIFGTINLLDLALKNNSIFIFASTSEVYGNPLIHPQDENYWGNVNPVGPRAIYDESKRAGETISYYYLIKKNLDVRIARIFNTYGPKMRIDDKRMIVNFIVQALKNKPITIYGNGKQTRSVCYIDDLIEGLIKIAFEKKTKGEIINLGNPKEHKVLEYAKIIKKITNSKSNIIFLKKQIDDPEKRKPDITKAKKILNWNPKINLEEGLKLTIDYYKNLI
ncbi:MAG: GDP-mannose 4,6-dehydratase [Patescibacteria group bacterium]|nr:GDP-mannose 4,6-dehydratase [Patescibacteria group bacterium]